MSSSERRLRIRLVHSPIGTREEHKRTVRALGLRRLGQEVVREDSPTVRGMVDSVSFLLDVSEEGK
jgi:large subunit ribosomal protein L30